MGIMFIIILSVIFIITFICIEPEKSNDFFNLNEPEKIMNVFSKKYPNLYEFITLNINPEYRLKICLESIIGLEAAYNKNITEEIFIEYLKARCIDKSYFSFAFINFDSTKNTHTGKEYLIDIGDSILISNLYIEPYMCDNIKLTDNWSSSIYYNIFIPRIQIIDKNNLKNFQRIDNTFYINSKKYYCRHCRNSQALHRY